MKFLISNKPIEYDLSSLPLKFDIHEIDGLYIILEEGVNLEKSKDCRILYDGYIRDLHEDPLDFSRQRDSVVHEIKNNWPLPEKITGSFSAVVIDELTRTITLCTDLIGLYPLYYLRNDSNLFVSNSIILTGLITEVPLDKAGIVQRSIGPEFANIGSRTILKNCRRLLPGECLRFNSEGDLFFKKYDNSLYNDISEPSQDHSLWREYWKAYQKEVKYCVNYSENVNIALSGGIDSRLALGAIPDNKRVTSYTFGNPKNYESKIAARLAKAKKAEFISCWNPKIYFPEPDILREYTLETEGVQLCSWLELTENVEKGRKEPLLLGELCEALPARKIAKFSTKKYRQENFIKYYVLKNDYSFEKASQEKFEIWKKAIINQYSIYYHEKMLSKFSFSPDRKDLLTCLNHDLNEIFSRIENHQLPFVELYDELFSWYTYTRMSLSKQLLVANTKFNAYSPAMSLQMLRKTSQLHPNIRLNYRFAKKVFTLHKELKYLYKIPTSQAPLIPQTCPDFFKFIIWGLRSKADQILIKRMMKTKDSDKRYRLFQSINWAKIYHHPKMEQNLKKYFKRNHLGNEYFQTIYNQAVKRRELKQWPFANINIINAASLNIELDLIKNQGETNEV